MLGRLFLVLVIVCHAAPALAFCRTRTCEAVGQGTCERDRDGCALEGDTLFWKSPCLDVGAQVDGSRRQGIEAGAVEALVLDGIDRWQSVACGGGAPRVSVAMPGRVECPVQEFNCDPIEDNQNAILFRDDSWDHEPAALALTVLTVNLRTGEILDADIELNSFGFEFSSTAIDLGVVLTHELGHFMGLSHSPDPSATMFAYYDASSWTGLHADDQEGICAIYPPGAALSCSPPAYSDTDCRGGTACAGAIPEEPPCTCRTPGAGRSRDAHGLSFAALLALVGTLARRRRGGLPR